MPDNETTEMRPPIECIKSSLELKKWYWMKDELQKHARAVGVKSSGAKFDILERLAHFLETGDKNWPGENPKRSKAKSAENIPDFNWHKEPLSLNTVITDSYKSSQNVRRFFKEYAGQDFKFTIGIMEWMKSNVGATLALAIDEYHAQKKQAAEPGFLTKIKPHNQFNQYTRDFLEDNPTLGMSDVRRIWALKRALPMQDGRHVYERSDLELEKDET